VTVEIRKVLIANRGEIALRVIRACRELGLQTVAVYSTADEHALHVRFADEAVCIGPGQAAQSYLNIKHIIAAAELTGADAVHPGYGFLSERAEFAEVVQKCGMLFIGPDPIHMQVMGDKVRARQKMESSGVPVLPGTGVLTSAAEAVAAAERIGLPVILKASAGGGGRGMKIIRDIKSLPQTLETAQVEAFKAFGCGDMYLERYVQSPRHVEVQIVADKFGDCVHLLERECSVQRRHQKVIEEAPCSALSDELRTEMCDAAVAAGKAIGYHSLGTIEFLLDGDRFYFMEMNTRVQVEHCVTEMITGLDLVQEQIRLARGEPLGHLATMAGPDQVFRHAATRSSAGSTPRTRSPGCRARGRSPRFISPGASACASTATAIRGTRFRPTTTRWSPRSSSTPRTARGRSSGCGARWANA
jgi:acetyl-CoA carboxylase biotin carboxylase subunit